MNEWRRGRVRNEAAVESLYATKELYFCITKRILLPSNAVISKLKFCNNVIQIREKFRA